MVCGVYGINIIINMKMECEYIYALSSSLNITLENEVKWKSEMRWDIY